ncbi:MAG: excinuclease ABC subunit UvrC [Candidatus Faecalibacterium intestinavium]|uniref:UvrABC system protein C n=1 Tax=Candidatus Faecalibacterium intestinavium TaxID=2838580 RepID=A0A9E2KKE5_9FIRM|nr:excinuclease ABC subunit UvrC [Candidatus Faecalibacterium intestinavium]
MTKAELYQKACMLPMLPGVYIIRDKTDTIIYIGKAKRLRVRVSQYFREGVPHDNKVTQMIAHAFSFDVIVCQSEFEALVLEASQIKAHTPKYNILLKDDKGYSYIKITREEWPRLSFVLQKEEDGAEYIGPYTSAFAAREMAESAMDAFLLPRCGKRFPQDIGKGRPCLNAHIGKCMGVCSGKIRCEEYNQAVKNAARLIRYGKKDILKTLRQRMEEASERLEFETAALLRDQIAAITKLSAGQKVVVDPDVEMDVIALAGTPRSVCAAVLRFREGRLTDKREFVFHDTADVDAVREEFLPRYYLDDEQVPRVVAVDELPPDADALRQALSEKRGSEVQLYTPQRGDKAHLIEMAHTNAVERLARESGRYAREEKLLDELAQVLGLAAPPRWIESYDISNWGDGSSVCGMVTFRDGKPYKAGYRRFKMRTVAGTDDYASLAETMARRAAEYDKHTALAAEGTPSGNAFGEKPDLFLMDGGKGQVSAARQALAGTALADVPLYGMVKDDHHRTRAIVDSAGREIAINMNRGTFTFITAIQDETHRFANEYRKQQMKKKSYSSALTELPGVGPKTAKALLTQFKTVGAVREASVEQLCQTPGVGPRMAEKIYETFHPAGEETE